MWRGHISNTHTYTDAKLCYTRHIIYYTYIYICMYAEGYAMFWSYIFRIYGNSFDNFSLYSGWVLLFLFFSVRQTNVQDFVFFFFFFDCKWKFIYNVYAVVVSVAVIMLENRKDLKIKRKKTKLNLINSLKNFSVICMYVCMYFPNYLSSCCWLSFNMGI